MITGLLLAAGESTRMGSPKPLLDWRGKPLIAYQIQQLRDAGCDQVVVVLGHAADRVRPFIDESHAQMAYNAGYREGRASSVRVGTAAIAAATDWVAVLGADQPRPASVTRQLIEAARLSAAAILIPIYRGRRGHPTLFAGRLLPEMTRVQDETLGLREVLVHHKGEIEEVEMDSADILLDLNTPADYARARAQW